MILATAALIPMFVNGQFNHPLRQCGLALVIVIWILTLLTLMAGSFAMTMRRDSSVSSAIKTSAEALARAEEGIILAQFMLAQPDQEQRWRADGTVYRVVNPDGEIRIRILSESGKVDINTAGDAQLAALINWATDDGWLQQQLLNAILDWRDDDDETRTMGAEKRQYRQEGLAYEPSNRAFQSLEELQLVLGMNEAIFSAVEPFITVYSGLSEVDVTNASSQLLAILTKDLKQRNMDDGAIQKRLEDTAGGNGETDNLGIASGGENQTYTIVAEAMLRNEASVGLEAVVQSQDGDTGTPFQVLDWKQRLQGQSLFDAAMDYPVITIDEFKYDDRY